MGHTIPELLPGLDPAVQSCLETVLETGEPATKVEVVGETPGRPGVHREFSESFWPVEVGEAMVVLDEGRVVYANEAFTAMTGYSQREIADLPSIFELIPEEQRQRVRRRAVLRLEGRAGPGAQLKLRHRGARAEVADKPGSVRRVAAVAHDVVVLRVSGGREGRFGRAGAGVAAGP